MTASRNFSKLLKPAILVACVLAVAFVVMSPYMPKYWPFQSKAQLEQIRASLPDARNRWAARGSSNYDIDVKVFIHMGFCTTDLGGKATTLNIRQAKLLISPEVRKWKLEDGTGCHISELLPPQAFDTVEKYLRQTNPGERHLTIEFDPDYGFIRVFFLTSNSSSSDLSITYNFSNYRPVPDSAAP